MNKDRPEAAPVTDGEKVRNTVQRAADNYPITGSVLIDLRHIEEDRIRHRCDEMRQVPDGVLVVLVVGDRWLVSYDALPVIREHVGRVPLEVQGDARAVARWIRAIRTGNIGDGLL